MADFAVLADPFALAAYRVRRSSAPKGERPESRLPQLADAMIPQSPLDVAFTVLGGPFGRGAKLAALTAGAALEPSEAEGGVLNRIVRAIVSKSAKLYNPPQQPLRPFEADYGTGARADAGGRLTHTIDGKPISPKALVAGRRMVGGADEAIPDSAIEGLVAQITSRRPVVLPVKELDGNAGALQFTEDARGRIGTRVATADDLTPPKTVSVRRHELGHAVDVKAGPWPRTEAQLSAREFGIPHRPDDYLIEEQLHRIYADLNNPPGGAQRILGPSDVGYVKSRTREELFAEAIRAYMADPNYLKTVAPNVAKRIREYVNTNPRLKDIIQFNAYLPFTVLGGLRAIEPTGAQE